MKLLFATDLHGSDRLYKLIVGLATVEQPRIIALGGDCFRNQKPWTKDARLQRSAVDGEFSTWLAEIAGAVPGVEVLIIPGNHDWAHAMAGIDALQERGLPVRGLHRRGHTVDGVFFVGYGCTPPSVFPTKDYERWDIEPGVTQTGCGRSGYLTDPDSDDGSTLKVDFRQALDGKPTMAEELATLPETPADAQRTVLIAHSPPWDTGLDHMWGSRPIGSAAVLAHLHASSPEISLHGHVHEAPEVSGRYQRQVGSTLAVNPGRSSSGLAAVILDTEDPAGTLRHTLEHAAKPAVPEQEVPQQGAPEQGRSG